MGTHPIFESDFDCLAAMKLVLFAFLFEFAAAIADSHQKPSFAPILPAIDDFPLAHNAGKKKNVWKKTVGGEKKSVFASYKEKTVTFVRRHYNNYMKDMSIEKIIATQIAAVVIFTLISSVSKAVFGSKKKSTVESAESEESTEPVEEATIAEAKDVETEEESDKDVDDGNAGLAQVETADDEEEQPTTDNEETKTDAAES